MSKSPGASHSSVWQMQIYWQSTFWPNDHTLVSTTTFKLFNPRALEGFAHLSILLRPSPSKSHFSSSLSITQQLDYEESVFSSSFTSYIPNHSSASYLFSLHKWAMPGLIFTSYWSLKLLFFFFPRSGILHFAAAPCPPSQCLIGSTTRIRAMSGLGVCYSCF